MKMHLLKTALVLAITPMLLMGCKDDEGDAISPVTTNRDIITVPFFAVDENGQTPTEASQLIFESRLQNPVEDRDGNHLTWGDFGTVRGMASITCKGNGVEVTLDLSGLIPNGVYTIWNAVFQAPGMDTSDPLLGIDGLGAAGVGDGSDNTFVASPDGKGIITIYSPAGPMSILPDLELGACPLSDNFEWHIIGSYHLDNLTHGPSLGPDGTVIEQFAFIFKQ